MPKKKLKPTMKTKVAKNVKKVVPARNLKGKAKTKAAAKPKMTAKPRLKKPVAQAKGAGPAPVKTVRAGAGVKKLVSKIVEQARLRKYLVEIAGENAIDVLQEFSIGMSDEELAKRTKIRVSEVRAVLNKLHGEGLVNYTRSRDKKTGWFSYVWWVNERRGETLLARQEQTVVLPEGQEFYFCGQCEDGRAYPFEAATDISFKCPKCGGLLKYLEKQ